MKKLSLYSRILAFSYSRILLSIPLIALLLLLPALIFGSGGNDLFTTSLYASHFAREFWSGQFYPRWLPEMFAGYGAPVFFFYPPLSFFVSALFAPLLPNDGFAFYPLLAATWVGLTISGFTFYAWMRAELCSKRTALIAACLYMMAPFHLAHSFYFTLLLAQCFAYAWWPLLMYFSLQLAARKKGAVIGFSVALSLLILTNIPSTIIFTPIAGLYALWRAEKSLRIKVLRDLLLAALLSAGMCAFYILPAFLYQDFTLSALQWSGKNGEPEFMAHFFHFDFSSPLAREYFMYGSSMLALLIVLAIAMRFLARVFSSAEKKSFFPFWIGVSAFGFFMNFPWSAMIWKWVPLVSIVQLPGRFLAIPTLALSISLAWMMDRAPRASTRVFIGMIIALSCALTVIASYTQRIDFESAPRTHAATMERFSLQIPQYPHYLVGVDVVRRFFTEEGLEKLARHNPFIETLSGDAKISGVMQKGRDISFDVHANGASVIAVRQFYFPGWEATSGMTSLPLTREAGSGRILISLPSDFGAHSIHLTLLPFWPETLGIFISCLAWVGVGVRVLNFRF